MSARSTTAFSATQPSAWARRLSGTAVILYALISMVPLIWIVMTGFKTPTDSISYPPSLLRTPSLECYDNLLTPPPRQPREYTQTLPPADSWWDRLVRSRGMVIAGPSKYGERFFNSLVIAFGSTFLAVSL